MHKIVSTLAAVAAAAVVAVPVAAAERGAPVSSSGSSLSWERHGLVSLERGSRPTAGVLRAHAKRVAPRLIWQEGQDY